MAILGDLNTTAWDTTLVTLAVCVLIAVVEILSRRMRHSATSGFKYFLLLAGVCWCGILGLSTLDNASDARHSSVSGKLHTVGYTYGGRGPGISMFLVCVADCSSTSVPLVMEPKAESVIKEHKNLPALKVEYLVQYEKVRADVSAFKVVDISDPSTGVSFYHLDTAHHPVRAGFLFADAALFLLTGLLTMRLARSEPDHHRLRAGRG